MELPIELQQRFVVTATLGRGGQGTTYLATDRETQTEVVLKQLDFLELGDWKDFELWQREAIVLRALEHPAIPRMLGHFPERADGESPELVVAIYEHIDGTTLEDELERADGPLFDERQATEFLTQMLDLLQYLHEVNPPVVHRDIKPSNIVRRPDGRYALIDFGAAQSRSALTSGSTFVGTNGYMPPEQLMGRAEPRSDLFALGATVVQLMTGLHPSDLSRDDLSLDLSHLSASPRFVQFVARLVQPVPERRYESARRAANVLATGDGALVLAERIHDGFELQRHEDDEIQIRLPAQHPLTQWSQVGMALIATLGFSLSVTPNPFYFAMVMLLIALAAVISLKRITVRLSPDSVTMRFVRRMSVDLEDIASFGTKTVAYPKNQVVVYAQHRSSRQVPLSGPVTPSQAEWLLGVLREHHELNR